MGVSSDVVTMKCVSFSMKPNEILSGYRAWDTGEWSYGKCTPGRVPSGEKEREREEDEEEGILYKKFGKKIAKTTTTTTITETF